MNPVEIEVYGADGAKLTPVGVEMNSQSGDYSADRCIDGDDNTWCHSLHWQEQGWEGPNWLRLDMGSDVVITKVVYVNRGRTSPCRANGQTVSVAADGDPDGVNRLWTSAPVSGADANGLSRHEFDTPATGPPPPPVHHCARSHGCSSTSRPTTITTCSSLCYDDSCV